MKRRTQLSVVFIALIFTTLACGYKTFGSVRVYSSTSGSVSQFYDANTDTILKDDVWIFYPNGKYKAVVIVDEKRTSLHGKYGAEDMGDIFVILIDTDGDGKFDEELYPDHKSTYFEWRHENNVVTYYLSP